MYVCVSIFMYACNCSFYLQLKNTKDRNIYLYLKLQILDMVNDIIQYRCLTTLQKPNLVNYEMEDIAPRKYLAFNYIKPPCNDMILWKKIWMLDKSKCNPVPFLELDTKPENFDVWRNLASAKAIVFQVFNIKDDLVIMSFWVIKANTQISTSEFSTFR